MTAILDFDNPQPAAGPERGERRTAAAPHERRHVMPGDGGSLDDLASNETGAAGDEDRIRLAGHLTPPAPSP